MHQIDRSKPVLVTGATGYVAGWLVKKLLEEGITVHAAVRDPENKKKIAHLKEIAAKTSGKIHFFKADLLDQGSYAEAMEGCELVYHTASPFTLETNDPQKELIDPALRGTQNVLNQANLIATVKRVVVTSSCAAIYTDASDVEKAPNGILTEEIWNSTASLDYQPYSYSKTLAEKEAWKIAESQTQWDLVTINPCLVLGPATNPKTATSESISILKQLGDGTLKMGVPNLGIGVVDVRDLAEAHLKAGFLPEANGRNIICAHATSMLQIAKIIHTKYGNQYPVPNKAIPKWLLMIIGPLVNKSITRKFIRNNVNIAWKADNSKGRRELQMKYRPMKDTLLDSFEDMIQNSLV